ncbi:ABC transporter substrate-binding protein [Consotaella salsifontis]|uniref:Carbohydrate ABC transporter substrate-binding protein, CUT1 family n=1 Tax=Consotaella salsifontis TaxID=1365950 RepID=A0A1T4SG07_9HYPH|nr:ABC transporter substrate-binding protein [Consotaella salsifontis]SKA27234.1 carbohydrate ABC transporter substrate-binding protein, CUT1 family [Consotaella salsifontis]
MAKLNMITGGIASLMAIFACSTAMADDVTLEYWVFSDFAQGDALALQETFIKEFTDKHPGVKIEIVGKGDDDLTAGQVAGAASGNLPDVFMNGIRVGAQLAEAGVLANLYDKWMAMPEEYRAQFDKNEIKNCMPEEGKLYCLPYTGYGSLLFRNLTVLEKAGIDPSKPLTTWDEWLDQMKKVKAAGVNAIPDQSLVFNSIAEMYAISGDASTWSIDWDARKTRIDPKIMAKVLEKFVAMADLNSGTSRNDQATKDLFITNQLAFHTVGPWVDPTYVEAAKNSGLKYDYVLIPGDTAGKHGGIKYYEFVGVAPGKNFDISWEFASFITEKEQMVRWAKLLSRYNSNAAAMNDPEVAALPLVAASVEAVKGAMDVLPPYFVKAVPNCYLSTVVDYTSATADGDYSPEEGAEEMISELNACLAQ